MSHILRNNMPQYLMNEGNPNPLPNPGGNLKFKRCTIIQLKDFQKDNDFRKFVCPQKNNLEHLV